jgi:DNA-binding NtrC family response regulator
MRHSILIADDDEQILAILSRYLGDQLGYDITGVSTGEEAIEQGLKKRFDLCILDSCLPTCSGTEVYNRLRSINPEIECIFFTGNSNFETIMDQVRFYLPKDHVLIKPLGSLSQLTRLIVSILGPPMR